MYEKLEPEFKKRWIEALRSGSYEQTQHTLRRKLWYANNDPAESYCCLGVACKIENINMGGVNPYEELIQRQLVSNDVQKQLVYLNDNKEWSFSQIASWLEDNV